MKQNHFEGATPEALARALLRPKRKPVKTAIKRKWRWHRPEPEPKRATGK